MDSRPTEWSLQIRQGIIRVRTEIWRYWNHMTIGKHHVCFAAVANGQCVDFTAGNRRRYPISVHDKLDALRIVATVQRTRLLREHDFLRRIANAAFLEKTHHR